MQLHASSASEIFHVRSSTGATIVCERERPATAPIGRCILAPAFGVTRLDLLSVSYALLCNGFEVVRFDLTNHVGDSDGQIVDFTMGQMAADIRAVVGAEQPDASLVAISLSGRAALRALDRTRLKGLFLLSPVVNTRHTLFAVSGEDLIGKFLAGTLGETATILGFEVKRAFCQECLESQFADLGSTITDANRVQTPTWLITGSADRWVNFDEVVTVAAAAPSLQVVSVTGANHQMFRSPVVLQAYTTKLLQELYRAYCMEAPPTVPRFRDVVRFVDAKKKTPPQRQSQLFTTGTP